MGAADATIKGPAAYHNTPPGLSDRDRTLESEILDHIKAAKKTSE